MTAVDTQPVAQHDRELSSLLGRCANYDQVALKLLYVKTSSQLFTVLCRILKVDVTAEDALQETYCKIWNHADRYRQELGRPLTWMISIARHHALDILRKNSAQNNLDSKVTLDAASNENGDVDAWLTEFTNDEILNTCLDRLDEKVKICIIKAYCEGYSTDELSDGTNAPYDTVKNRIQTGLISLRGCLNEHA